MSVTMPTSAVEALKCLEWHVEKLSKKADDNMPAKMQLKPMPYISAISESSFHVRDYYGGSKPPTTLAALSLRKDVVLKEHEKLKQDIEQVHTGNLPALAVNKTIHEKMTLVMQQAGIGTTFSVREVPKGKRTMQWVTKPAGWVADLAREAPTSDGFDSAMYSMKNRAESIEQYYKKMAAKLAEEEKKAAAEVKAQTKILELAKLQVKYDLPATTDADGILEHLRGIDKYFNLAYAMEATRNDWNDGFYKVENALASFVVEKDLDKEIEKELKELLNSEEQDGRIFRDCRYNYGHLYILANPAIVQDYQTLSQYLEV